MEENKFYEEAISELRAGLTPFPEDIFVSEQSWLSNYLLPLISIDLGLFRQDLAGTTVHMLNPTEPYDGLIGEVTTDFHNEFCAENWIALELTEDNKYRFLANEDYFLSSPKHKDKTDADFTQHIQEIQKNYQKVKATYQEKGLLLPWQANNPQSFLDSLGGEIWYGNWTDTAAIPSAFDMRISELSHEEQPDDGVAISYQGKAFMYIGEVAGYNYCGEGADAILLFYEPESRIVLFTYDWT